MFVRKKCTKLFSNRKPFEDFVWLKDIRYIVEHCSDILARVLFLDRTTMTLLWVSMCLLSNYYKELTTVKYKRNGCLMFLIYITKEIYF